MSMEDALYDLMEQHRIEELKKLRKTKIDYDQLLKTVPIDEIEKYLRKLKLENINKGIHGIL
jgi:hypothetical protein